MKLGNFKYPPLSTKLCAAFSALIVAGVSLGASAKTIKPETSAREAFLVETTTGAVLFEKDADKPAPPASMSKLMTLYVIFDAIDRKKLSPDDVFTVSRNARAQPGSRMFIEAGETLRVEDLIRGAVIQSGNDACVALAEGYAGDVNAFVDIMNAKAKELGLKNSSFVNVTGLPNPEHLMSARDLATLAVAIINRFPEFYQVYRETEFTWAGIKQGNRNPLLYMGINADGVKTGHTQEAGYGLVGSAVQNGMRLVSVATGMNSMRERGTESRKLLSYGFREYRLKQIGGDGKKIAEAEVALGTAAAVPAVLKGSQTVLTRRGDDADLTARFEYKAPLVAPIKEGDRIGQLFISVSGGAERELPVYAGASVGESGPAGRIWENLKHFIFGSQNISLALPSAKELAAAAKEEK